MIDIKLKDIALAVGGRLANCNEDAFINQVIIDSRKLQPLLEEDKNKRILFVAIKGEQVDGNEYAAAAFKSGAAAVLTGREILSDIEVPIPQIIVQDTCIALKMLAKYYRKYFDIPFIGVTGSTGKTSTKEMIASVLSQQFNVHKTLMNFNNEIGLPLTMLELESANEISVLEMGMDKFGEIECLAEISKPSIGVITNIGTAHIENLGSRQNIMKAKLELTTWFDKNNILIINADDDCLKELKDTVYLLKKISTCGNGDYNAQDIQLIGADRVEFKCNFRGEIHQFKLNVPGKHNVYNAMAAIAIADGLNMNIEQIKKGVEEFRPVGQRLNIIELSQNVTIVNDCYNANPDSMKAALEVLLAYKPRRRIAVLGDMYELGSYTEQAHRLVGEYAAERCDMLVAVGESAECIYRAAKEKQIESLCSCEYYKTKDEASAYLKSIINKDDVVLIKASRGMKMEDITNSLVEDANRERDSK